MYAVSVEYFNFIFPKFGGLTTITELILHEKNSCGD